MLSEGRSYREQMKLSAPDTTLVFYCPLESCKRLLPDRFPFKNRVDDFLA